MTVAALLPRSWSVRLVDLNIQPLTAEDLAWADYVPLGGTRGLAEGYKAAMRWLYSPKPHYQRIRVFLQEHEQRNPAALGNLRAPFTAIMAFVRSVFHLGIVGKERFEYWKRLVWTLIHRLRAFGLAITCAIYGHQFRLTCERHLV